MGSFNPSFDVTETKDAYMVKADVPGVKKEEIEITTTGNRLQLSGKRETEHETKSDTVYTYERRHRACENELKDGVLTLVIPNMPGAQAKKIAITTGATKS